MTRFLPALLVALLVLPGTAMAQDTDVDPALAAPRVTPTLFDNPDLVKTFAESITAKDLAAHLYFFASDFFQGRETTQPGQKLAAEYLASQYRRIGLEPKGTGGNGDPRSPSAYMQPFTVYGSRFQKATLTASAGGATVANATFGGADADGSLLYTFGTGSDVSGGLVFAGYGIADEELGYDDYAALTASGASVDGKWIMILADEPMTANGHSVLTADGEPSRWTSGRFTKFSQIMQAGGTPKGILVVGDVSPASTSSVADQVAERAGGPQGAGSLSLTPPSEASGSGRRRSFPPVFTISADLANTLLASTSMTVQDIATRTARTKTPVVFGVDGVEVTGSVVNEAFEAQTENVVAYIEGSDLKDELVVMSSHYDHIGISGSGEDRINNGADDDGSGTVTTLEMAEAFMRAKEAGFGPRRSLLFMNVTGEEKGLLGSAWYTDHEPLFPLEKTVTNLNIDMIGRVDPTHPGPDGNYVYLIGSNLISQELHDINVEANSVMGTGLDLNERFNSKDDPNQFYRRSDHWNFGKHSIPFIFFFTGTHDDYHGVDDEPEKIGYERMEQIARLIFATAWQVANQDQAPAVTGEGFN